MRFYDIDGVDPYTNLATEEYLFESLPPEESCFMLWQNSPSIIVGRYQNTYEEINAAFVRERDLPVVRRLSGGGAVYHDLGNLNYTLIEDLSGQEVPGQRTASRERDAETDSWRTVMKPFLNLLRDMGLSASFSGRNDVEIGGRKIAGCARYSRGNRVLHHGCILLSSNLRDVEEALRVSPDKYTSKGVSSVRSRVATVNELLKEPVSMKEFRRKLADCYLSSYRTLTLSGEEQAAIQKLREKKYTTWEWNYGKEARYRVEKSRRFSGGRVNLSMNVEEGVIRDIRISGDFFALADPMELEAALVGQPLNNNLAGKLSEMDVSRYLEGVSSEELARLLLE